MAVGNIDNILLIVYLLVGYTRVDYPGTPKCLPYIPGNTLLEQSYNAYYLRRAYAFCIPPIGPRHASRSLVRPAFSCFASSRSNSPSAAYPHIFGRSITRCLRPRDIVSAPFQGYVYMGIILWVYPGIYSGITNKTRFDTQEPQSILWNPGAKLTLEPLSLRWRCDDERPGNI